MLYCSTLFDSIFLSYFLFYSVLIMSVEVSLTLNHFPFSYSNLYLLTRTDGLRGPL